MSNWIGIQIPYYMFELHFKILIQLYLNPIQLNINSIQLKLHAMTINIFIQMEFNFHKNYSFLINWLSLDLVHRHVKPKYLLSSNVKTRTKGSLNKEKPHNTN